MKETPKIRFKGFTDAWEQREFKNIFDILQNNALSRAELSDEQGSAMNVHYGDILVRFGEVLNIDSEHLPYIIDDAIVKKYFSSKLQDGDVIIADAAEDETVGKCTEIANLQDKTVLAGLHTIPVRTKEKFSCGYLGYYLNSNSYHDQLLPLMQGTKVSSISKSAIQDTMIFYPKSAEEQKAIGSYFTNLDTLITLHQRKYEKLVQVKKSMLEKMFPKNGESVPEIRFKGFTNPWEQRELGDVGSCQSGIGFPEAEQGGTDGIPFFKVSDMNIFGNEYELLFSNNYVNEEQIERKKWKPITEVPAMLFAKVGAAVMLNRKRLVNTPFLLDNNTMAYKFSDAWDTNFGRTLFDTINLASLVQIGALPSYNASDVENIKIALPTLEEQIAIGTYFKNLDNLITLHQRKYEKLKNIKKALLEKMFV